MIDDCNHGPKYEQKISIRNRTIKLDLDEKLD